ncbi:MAG: winged helix-turn-helix domain-containing protein [Bacteroidota bacterium]
MTRSNNQNSAIKFPLNDILGSKGHVKVLRQLAESEHPMSPSELINRTSLSRQGTYDVVQRLIENGIVKYVGSGKQQQIILREDYPLTDIISKLFKKEKDRYDNLIERIKGLIDDLNIKPKSAWIFGKLAQGSDAYGDPVQIALLGKVKNIDEITECFRDSIYENNVEKDFDVTIDISGVTIADLESKPMLNVENVILLWGMDPQHYLASWKDKRSRNKMHQDLDRQSLHDSGIWIELLKMHPDIIKRTINDLEDRIQQTRSGEKKELQEWKHILESMSFQRLKKFLESDSERSTRLRQSLPFWPVLKNNEREELMKIKSRQEEYE